ncbi:hypothetical protein Aperf_G00000072010 [Anoplocephala perfoliata]
MAEAKLSSVLFQAHSFPGTRNLPLDLPPEPEEGNIEYKLKLVNPTPDRLEHLMTQMKWRLNEGGGQAIYRLGVDDGGAVTGLTAREMTASLRTLYKMAEKLGVDFRLLRERTLSSCLTSPASALQRGDRSHSAPQKKAVELHAKWKVAVNKGIPDMRVALLGSVDVGKSTLLGILTEGVMDDGRGRARLNIFCHLHEVQSGRTSSLSSEVIGFDTSGRLVNRRRSKGQVNNRTIDEVIRDSNRLITLIDLAGHCKYQRTTLAGLTVYQPAFCFLVVSATTGLSAEGLSHARTAAALGLPLAVVLSKVDLILDVPIITQRRMSITSTSCISVGEEENSLCGSAIAELRRSVLQELNTIKFYELSPPGADGISINTSPCFSGNIPVFAVSCVSGYGVNDLLNFLREVSSPHQKILESAPVMRVSPFNNDIAASMDGLVECWVTRVFNNVTGVGNPVLEVLVRTGQVHNSQRLWLGPNEEGLFYPVRVVELRQNRRPHHVLFKNQIGSLLAVAEPIEETYNFPAPRRGMIMVNVTPTTSCSASHQPSIAVCWSFSISNLLWIAPGTSGACLQPNSTVGIHAGNVMQYARVLKSTLASEQLTGTVDYFKGKSNSVILRLDPSDKLIVAFLRQPEFLEVGRQVVISRNNVANVIGSVAGFEHAITFFSDADPPPQVLSPGDPYTSPLSNAASAPWHDMPNSFIGTSFETLLTQIGIDPEGPRTHFIGEPPPPPEVVALENLSSINQIRKRHQRNAKRRRKANARLATMTSMAALPSMVGSSAGTCNGHENGSSGSSLRAKEVGAVPVEPKAAEEGRISNQQHSAPRRRRRKRKRKPKQ